MFAKLSNVCKIVKCFQNCQMFLCDIRFLNICKIVKHFCCDISEDSDDDNDGVADGEDDDDDGDGVPDDEDEDRDTDGDGTPDIGNFFLPKVEKLKFFDITLKCKTFLMAQLV